MITRDDGFDLHTERLFPEWRRYAFAGIILFIFLIVIYANSFDGAWQFDDTPNIVENRNVFLKTLDWPDLKKTFHAPEGKISRPLSYLSFALNYYVGGLDIVGYHIVNFIIHYLASVFLFLFLYNTLKLPTVRERYGPSAYGIALLATVFWATSPVQTTAVTYIVQRMASMAGLFYITALYLYLKGRTAGRPWGRGLFWGLCALSALLSFASKENAAMLPVSIWLYDLILIQGVTRESIKKNAKVLIPVLLTVLAIGLLYTDLSNIFDGYRNRPFTLTERLLTEPRVIIWYITLLLYPVSPRLTLIHDIEPSRSLLTPWDTLPAIALIGACITLAVYGARKRPLIAFCVLFFLLNHVIESSFLPLELIYEHRNYIPSMCLFVPVAVFIIRVLGYFSYRKVLQLTVAAAVAVLLWAQGHTVFIRNAIFESPLLLWSDNVEKAPALSRPYNNLGAAYWDLGRHEEAYEAYSKALEIDRQTNLLNRGVNLYNLGVYHLHAKGEPDRALELFRSALEAYPGYWPAYHDTAICHILKGNLFEAGKTLLVALSAWPDNAYFRHAMGFVLLKTGKYNQAIREARRALSLDPNLDSALCILGEAFRRKGSYRPATVCWERYIEKHPNDPEGNLALIELYDKSGDRDALSRTIGRLLCLKGSQGWRAFVGGVLRDTRPLAYTPEPEEIVSIITGSLHDQEQRPGDAPRPR
ncbi:MAG: tetratricopeptide repeat protein [Deltaproteobacteria bacterium]|nr:tetratricopeptide repeat protein [Deltaproteobacteria bacterium]